MAQNFNATSAASMTAPNANDYSYGFDKDGYYTFDGFMDSILAPTYTAQMQEKLNKQWELDTAKYLDSTRYQRMVEDLKAAGLNPWLALSGGGSSSPGSATGVSSSNPGKKKGIADRVGDLATTAVKFLLMAAILG